MEHFGIWGIIPPILTIALAFITKDVIVSLFIGILSGALIAAGGNPLTAMMNLSDLLADSLSDGWNIRIFMFCALLGGLVGLLSKTGAAGSFGRWAAAKLKTGKTTQFAAFVFGIVIFIDDYFNSLAVGTVMRPITDKAKVSRAKLAYILDSTAAPICILAPISSWVVTVMSIVRKSEGFSTLGMSEFAFFIRSIPYNLYALTALAFVVYLIITKRDFGPMKRSEELARTTGVLFNEKEYGPVSGNLKEETNAAAKPIDMFFPIIVLVVSAVIFFPVVTWIGAVNGEDIKTFGQAVSSMSLAAAFNDTDSSVALMYSVIFTIVISYIYYIARKLMNLKTAGEALRSGIESMVPALIILVMAWSIGSIIKSPPAEGGLGLGVYLSELVKNNGFPLAAVPPIVFLLSALISFSTGTSWGTFSIMIPIVMPIAVTLAQQGSADQAALLNAVLICVSAVIGGAVFGDHASPISDTTILSSTGASCPHLEHVATQMPYAVFTAVCALAGFIIGGITLNAAAAWITTAAVFAGGQILLPKILTER